MPGVAALEDPLLAGLREEALEQTLNSLAEGDWRELVDLFERLHGAAARRSVSRALDQLLLALYEIYLEAPDGELWGRLPAGTAPPDADAIDGAIATLDRALRETGPGTLRKALLSDLESARSADWSWSYVQPGLRRGGEPIPAHARHAPLHRPLPGLTPVTDAQYQCSCAASVRLLLAPD